jgi:hypothetical protein
MSDSAFLQELAKYLKHGSFSFKQDQALLHVCNAPTNASGIYAVFNKHENGTADELLYVGISGAKRNPDGTLMHRTAGLGGIKDRIVNGHHLYHKMPRRRAWPKRMEEEGISEITVDWWVTYDDDAFLDFPRVLEEKILRTYLKAKGALPRWNKII